MCWLLAGSFARASIINVTVTSDAETGASISDTLAVNGAVVGQIFEAFEPNTMLVVTFNDVIWQSQRYIRLTEAGDNGLTSDILAFINTGMNAAIVFGSDDEAGNIPNIPIPPGVMPETASFDANNSFTTTAVTVPEPANEVLLLASGLVIAISINWRRRRGPRVGKGINYYARRLTMPGPSGNYDLQSCP
jgi:hypothetical protein